MKRNRLTFQWQNKKKNFRYLKKPRQALISQSRQNLSPKCIKDIKLGVGSLWVKCFLVQVRIPSTHIKSQVWGWGDGSAAKRADCSCGGPGFSPQHPQGGSWPSLTLAPGDPMSSSDLWAWRTRMMHTHIHAGKSLRHKIEWINLNLKIHTCTCAKEKLRSPLVWAGDKDLKVIYVKSERKPMSIELSHRNNQSSGKLEWMLRISLKEAEIRNKKSTGIAKRSFTRGDVGLKTDTQARCGDASL